MSRSLSPRYAAAAPPAAHSRAVYTRQMTLSDSLALFASPRVSNAAGLRIAISNSCGAPASAPFPVEHERPRLVLDVDQSNAGRGRIDRGDRANAHP